MPTSAQDRDLEALEHAVEVADIHAAVTFTPLDRNPDATWTGMSVAVLPGDGSPVTARKLRSLDLAGFNRVATIREAARARGFYLESPYGPDGDR